MHIRAPIKKVKTNPEVTKENILESIENITPDFTEYQLSAIISNIWQHQSIF